MSRRRVLRRRTSGRKIGASALVPTWKLYEIRKARERGGIHIGGPGAPDYIRGEEKKTVS